MGRKTTPEEKSAFERGVAKGMFLVGQKLHDFYLDVEKEYIFEDLQNFVDGVYEEAVEWRRKSQRKK